jgi:hypothetical protein
MIKMTLEEKSRYASYKTNDLSLRLDTRVERMLEGDHYLTQLNLWATCPSINEKARFNGKKWTFTDNFIQMFCKLEFSDNLKILRKYKNFPEELKPLALERGWAPPSPAAQAVLDDPSVLDEI